MWQFKKNVYFCIHKKNRTTDKNHTEMNTKSNLKLKDWALEDRPREKLIANGKKELSTAELIAILLGSGSVGQSAVDVAKELLNSADNRLSFLSRMGIGDLTKNHKGVGEAKAITIIAALELGYRMLAENSNQEDVYLKDSNEMFGYIGPKIIDLPTEEFWAIYMNNRRKVIFRERISSGGFNATSVDIRKIFSTALGKNALYISVAHNHPTGHLNPSKEDKMLTTRILEAGKMLNIPLVDHLIVGISDNGVPSYYSFHDNGLL